MNFRVRVRHNPPEGIGAPDSGARFAQVVFMFPGVCPAAAVGCWIFSISSLQLLEDTTSRIWEYGSKRVHSLLSLLEGLAGEDDQF